jgi:hypothetical protein
LQPFYRDPGGAGSRLPAKEGCGPVTNRGPAATWLCVSVPSSLRDKLPLNWWESLPMVIFAILSGRSHPPYVASHPG